MSLFSLLFLQINSQDWPKVYGGYFHCYVNRVIEDYDFGYLLGGDICANYTTFKYAWIIKTDINGNELWNKKYGNGAYQNYLGSCTKTADQGLVACGNTTLSDPQFDPFFFKLNVCGEVEWCTILLSNGNNDASGIIAIEDGYIGMLRYYRSDSLYARICLIKLNTAGEPLWISYLAQEDTLINNEEGGDLYLTEDKNFLVSGECFHPGLKPFWIKTNTSGNQIWDLIWEGGIGAAYQVCENNDGYFYSAGGFKGTGYPMTPSIFKFDNSGIPVYQKYLLGDTLVGGGADPISLFTDSTLLTGINWSVSLNVDDGYSDILKIDTLGNILNRRTLLHENRCPTEIIKTHDNKIVVTGFYTLDYYFDICLWKMNTNLEDDTLYTQPMTYDSLCPYEIQSDTMDLDCELFVNIDELPTREEYESTVKIYPNPAEDWVALTLPDIVAAGKVEIAVYDVFGREVETGRRGDEEMGGQGEVPVNRMLVLDVSGYPPGMYVVVVTDQKGRRYTGKVVVA
ncbi:MAG: T9SS type A sorting domain-containing protein [Bacteroidales bacterium]|nr:T9SS type A sorting domain-containing protein [Bacteroidales bacterium]